MKILKYITIAVALFGLINISSSLLSWGGGNKNRSTLIKN